MISLIFINFQASTYGVEPHNYQQKPHFPIVEQATHEKSFNLRPTSSLISVVMRPDLATSGNLKVKCVVTLLTLYHRSNEISVETVGLVQPKLKTSRHLPPTMFNDIDSENNQVFKNNHRQYLNGASADYFAGSRMNSAISRYKFNLYPYIIFITSKLFYLKCNFV